MYNQTAFALVEFEYFCYQAWMDEVSKLDCGSSSGSDIMSTHCEVISSHYYWFQILSPFSVFLTVLNVTLLVRHPETRKFVINLDHKVTEVIRDTKYLLKMGLEVPKPALSLVKLESKINATRLRLQVSHHHFLCYSTVCISEMDLLP